MNKFLKTHKLPKLTQEEVENLNRSVTTEEIESGIQKLPTKTSLGSGDFTDKFQQIFSMNINPSKTNIKID